LTGWFDEWVRIMRKYNHVVACGMVVPTKVRASNYIDEEGTPHLTLDRDEFEQILIGMEKIGRIYLAAARPGNGVTLYLPTKGIILDTRQEPLQIRSHSQLT